MFANRSFAVSYNMLTRSITASCRYFSSLNNNESYAYLKKHNHDWSYDPLDVHSQVHEKLEKRFDEFDVDGDGVIQKSEIMSWPERVQSTLKVDMSLGMMDTIHSFLLVSSVESFFGSIGITEEGLNKEDWVEAYHAFYQAEILRLGKGDTQKTVSLANAFFDVIDVNNDEVVDMEEFRVLFQAWGLPNIAAYTFFDDADVDKDALLTREEMQELFRDFWLKPVAT